MIQRYCPFLPSFLPSVLGITDGILREGGYNGWNIEGGGYNGWIIEGGGL
jgi:hypothetical protein